MTTGPEPVIHGRLTFLRAPERSDVPLFVRWMNDYATTRFINARAPMGEAQEQAWFEEMLGRQGSTGWFFVICALDDGRALGNVGLFELDLVNGSAGIGITIGDPSDRGAGFGSDALESLLDFGFARLRLERMWLDVYDFNPAAVRAYEKCGFTREGVKRHAAYRDGSFIDVILMSILRDEWSARRVATPFPGAWPTADRGASPQPD